MYGREDVGYQPKNCKSGTDFENWVQRLLTAAGFDARRTGGNDNGVDIIATITLGKKEYKYYIQCKFHNRPVGRPRYKKFILVITTLVVMVIPL